ncbi:cyclase family protein [Tepidanaerobacter syntrophicus]|uniref:Kynurenine formamidase n=1 Tax=Tepidanaerobacter syntrophicus TaxID=224999 RepID=A0A0U9HIM5_9FIRM|nr:cyclase family protein [Tepidanaerobacter syntrophicus]GAQ25148.1 arylformamidase [Tepidanaerobacter syntrophicus]GLI18635.1 kynurenine formamidase [Tepidanaerobacter syntrophicus]
MSEQDLLKGTKIIDISSPLYNEMDKYPSLEGFKLQWIRTISNEDRANMSRITMESHVGTHVDAPLHFIKNGKSIDQMPLQNLLGIAEVIEIPYPCTVTKEFLEKYYKGNRILLFKFGKNRYNRNFDYFDLTATDFFIRHGVKALGTDNFSVDSKNTKYKIHEALLKNEVWIVEGLNFENVTSGVFEFICLPLLIKNAEGSPARAILLEKENAN